MEREYFSFELSSGIDLALPLTDMKVATQFEVANICVVPGVADFWYGVTNFKGSLVWVLDSNRFFDINKSDRHSLKITSVILHQQQAQKKLAIVTNQLKGIISIQPDSLKPIENDTSILSKCCNAMVQTEALSTYIIESAALLEQLQKRSLLDTSLVRESQSTESIV